jgi:glycylpeptide N-tetradecanoyltransferase
MSHVQEIIDTTQDSDREDHSSGSEAEHPGHIDNSRDAPQASSSKRTKKKKSKAGRILDSLRGNEIPQSIVDHAVPAGQGHGIASPDAEAVMQALNHLKLMDAIKGKSSITGRGKNPFGEHKVSSLTSPHLIFIACNYPFQVLGDAARPSIGRSTTH